MTLLCSLVRVATTNRLTAPRAKQVAAIAAYALEVVASCCVAWIVGVSAVVVGSVAAGVSLCGAVATIVVTGRAKFSDAEAAETIAATDRTALKITTTTVIFDRLGGLVLGATISTMTSSAIEDYSLGADPLCID